MLDTCTLAVFAEVNAVRREAPAVPPSDAYLELEVALDAGPEVMRYLTGLAISRAEAGRAQQQRLAAAREVPGLGFWVGFTADEFAGWCILQPPHGPDQPKVAREADLG